MANPAVDPQIKVNSLKTLGFICEDIAPEALESSSDKILTAIISGMRRFNPFFSLVFFVFSCLLFWFSCLLFWFSCLFVGFPLSFLLLRTISEKHKT